MRLISLELKNFRQHIEAEIHFPEGVTGIVGANGAGKSTVLEAVAWALYGAPAVRGTNETIRSVASDGGSRASAALTFELGGQVYKATRSLDSGGRSGHAVLEVDGKALRTGMTDVSDAITRLLGMDYRAFFTSFFTGQKQIEFMAAMDGRQRAVAISRMLGYDRLTRARDQANEDRKGLGREIEGLEQGLADPEELKERKRAAESALANASTCLGDAELAHKKAQAEIEKLKPIKELSDQRAKRHDEIARRLEIDRSDLARTESRLAQLREELQNFEAKRKELDSLKPDLARYDEAGRAYREMKPLQEHEAERQRLTGQITTIETDLKKLQTRHAQLASAQDQQTRAAIALSEAENQFASLDEQIRKIREDRVAREHSLAAQIRQLTAQKTEIEANRARIAEAGSEGKCPTCERPLAGELDKVIANFDAEISGLTSRIASLDAEQSTLASDTSALDKAESDRRTLSTSMETLRAEKTEADARVSERDKAAGEIELRIDDLKKLSAKLDALPKGFDQARFRELQKIGEDLRPVRERYVALKSALEREPDVARESEENSALLESLKTRVSESDKSLAELAFSQEDHQTTTQDFDAANARLNASAIDLERCKGDLNTANAILAAIKQEELSHKSKLEDLAAKRSERLHLQTLAEAFDKLRAELNDRIRPELESIASELLSTMTDGRYNVLEINDSYQAMIRDDGELKPVISGGEDDIVNLALRLAISQMIADRAGQSFSLLILDEVFGSLDETRRENVVALLQNLKNRFEQIILITHIESIHDAVDNCLWVQFDEKTKTSRITTRADEIVPDLVQPSRHPQTGLL